MARVMLNNNHTKCIILCVGRLTGVFVLVILKYCKVL